MRGIVFNKRLFKLTVIALFEKIVSVVVIFFTRLDLFRRDILLHVGNENLDVSVCASRRLFSRYEYCFLKLKKHILTGSSLASLLTMLSK